MSFLSNQSTRVKVIRIPMNQTFPTTSRLLRVFLVILACLIFLPYATLLAQTFDLWVDPKTKQIFSEGGPGRTRLGKVMMVQDESAPSQGDKTVASATSSSSPSTGTISGAGSASGSAPTVQVVPVAAQGTTAPKSSNWYDRFSVRGYTQMRYHTLLDKEGADWMHPADRSVADDASFIIRRGRLILSGDVTDHLYMYIQPDMMAAPSSEADYSLQMRDLYGDLSLDKKKEFRLRFGQSKVPFGFVNMQSSQNRLALERAEALNSAVETERDLGVFFYWAPEEIRERFRNLIKDGLKGSGDYGVFGVGAYTGQGPNRADTNNSVHTVVRASYPFKMENGQMFEPGLQAYTGKFVPRTRAFTLDDSEEEIEPEFREDGVTDQRVGATFVWYPQPIGVEAEWNVGKGPQLSDDNLTINDEFLHGGYIQVSSKLESSQGLVFPFVRWQYYDGARKFARNAPAVHLNEWDFGIEWQPYPEFELVGTYTYSVDRTNTGSFPYEQISGGSRIGIQAQLNY